MTPGVSAVSIATGNSTSIVSSWRDLVIGVVAGLLVSTLLWLAKRVMVRHRARRLTAFWSPFLQSRLAVVMTEYPAIGSELTARTAKRASGGYLVSRGNALAMARIKQYLQGASSAASDQVVVVGDKSSAAEAMDLVVIGSPANNQYARAVFDDLEAEYDLPFSVVLDAVSAEIKFRHEAGELIPRIDRGNGTDYALVIRAKLRKAIPTRHVLVLAGAYMYGAEAAAEAVTERQLIDQVHAQSSGDVMFLIRTQVVNYQPQRAVLDDTLGRAVFPLHVRPAPSLVNQAAET